ncbi:acyl-coenzyme A thioesterase THEM4-like [Spea bombifrons]|uniref:acyl-coenzyme A thioesterase THEM4-like n=1 Tax=Spea bombifrons TaxID=233779 RepID=UPI00234967C4|nr:acyl-coenzyme A thioesterase THEM4-like [Spea bombifrons]
MLRSCARLIRGGTAICHPHTHLPNASSIPCHFSITRPCPVAGLRDFGLPNATWSQKLLDLFNKFEELSKNGEWRRIPSYNTTVHHMEGDVNAGRENRLFTRNTDQDGVGFEYSMFYNTAEKRMVCLFQPGHYLEGPPGFTHGGCIATIIDSTAGAGAVYGCGTVMTANLNIDYRNPIPLGRTVIVDSKVENVEGRKVFCSCQIRSHDDEVLHTEATVLFIKVGS